MLPKYRNAHLWLAIPFAIVMVAFAESYWFALGEAPWRQHLHGLAATGWFVLLILQPWLITRGHTSKHRLYGMLGLLLAGGVVVSGLGAIPYNLVNEGLPPMARYGLSFVDVVLVGGFATSVIMAIRHARVVDEHARWMVSTVFWTLPPATFRLLLGIAAATGTAALGQLAPFALMASALLNIPILVYLMVRAKRAHPAYVLATVGSLLVLVALPIGGTHWWVSIADALFVI